MRSAPGTAAGADHCSVGHGTRLECVGSVRCDWGHGGPAAGWTGLAPPECCQPPGAIIVDRHSPKSGGSSCQAKKSRTAIIGPRQALSSSVNHPTCSAGSVQVHPRNRRPLEEESRGSGSNLESCTLGTVCRDTSASRMGFLWVGASKAHFGCRESGIGILRRSQTLVRPRPCTVDIRLYLHLYAAGRSKPNPPSPLAVLDHFPLVRPANHPTLPPCPPACRLIQTSHTQSVAGGWL